MNHRLRLKLNRIREFCKDNPSSITVVKLCEGAPVVSSPFLNGGEFIDFLRESDGGRFGIVDIFGRSQLSERQTDFDKLDYAQWFCVGQVLYDPLLLRRDNGVVAIFHGDANQMTNTDMTFDQFIDEFVLGRRYGELCPHPEDDRWYQTMSTLSLE